MVLNNKPLYLYHRFIMWQNWTFMQEEMMCGFLGVIYVQEVGFLSF